MKVFKSPLIANAAKARIEHLKNQSVIDRLNKVYATKSTESQVPKELAEMQVLSILKEDW